MPANRRTSCGCLLNPRERALSKNQKQVILSIADVPDMLVEMVPSHAFNLTTRVPENAKMPVSSGTSFAEEWSARVRRGRPRGRRVSTARSASRQNDRYAARRHDPKRKRRQNSGDRARHATGLGDQ